MILPPVVRVFFAIDPPAVMKATLSHYIDSLKQLSRSSKIRWTRPENLHITLQFLPEVRSEDIPGMVKLVQAELATAESPLHLAFREMHFYPDPHRPRVLVLDVAPQTSLSAWSALIGKGIQKAGYEIESRAFRAHLSIGRIKTTHMTALNFLATAPPPVISPIAIQEVVLFQSEPHPDGSRYIPLTRIELGT
jgi:2'-5' RNA ligase